MFRKLIFLSVLGVLLSGCGEDEKHGTVVIEDGSTSRLIEGIDKINLETALANKAPSTRIEEEKEVISDIVIDNNNYSSILGTHDSTGKVCQMLNTAYNAGFYVDELDDSIIHYDDKIFFYVDGLDDLGNINLYSYTDWVSTASVETEDGLVDFLYSQIASYAGLDGTNPKCFDIKDDRFYEGISTLTKDISDVINEKYKVSSYVVDEYPNRVYIDGGKYYEFKFVDPIHTLEVYNQDDRQLLTCSSYVYDDWEIYIKEVLCLLELSISNM